MRHVNVNGTCVARQPVSPTNATHRVQCERVHSFRHFFSTLERSAVNFPLCVYWRDLQGGTLPLLCVDNVTLMPRRRKRESTGGSTTSVTQRGRHRRGSRGREGSRDPGNRAQQIQGLKESGVQGMQGDGLQGGQGLKVCWGPGDSGAQGVHGLRESRGPGGHFGQDNWGGGHVVT